MKLNDLVDSRTYFEISNHILHGCRLEFAKTFFFLLAALPIAVGFKLWRTALKGFGVLTGGVFLLLTIGFSKGIRELFVSRVSAFAANVADWVLFPFALATCLSRLILASLIHPALFIR